MADKKMHMEPELPSGDLKTTLDQLDLEKDEDMKTLRTIRRQRKAAITRTAGGLDRSISERDPAQVHLKLSTLRQQFVNFEYVHDVYHTELSDESEIIKSEEFFVNAQVDYTNCVKAAKKWLDSVDDTGVRLPLDHLKRRAASGSPESVSKIQSDEKIIDLLSMPSKSLPKFSGEPLRYPAFESMIKDEILCKNVSDSLKLSRIIESCEGDALRSIRNCPAYGTPSEGLKDALVILKERYGADHIITQALLKSLKSSKQISKPVEIRDLYDDLKLAERNFREDVRSDFDNQEIIKNIVKRCPAYVVNMWRKRVFKHLEDEGKYPTFSKFVEFFKEISTQANDPMYGQDFWSEATKVKGTGLNNFAGVSGSKPPNPTKCPKCAAAHPLFQCDEFKSLNIDDRMKLIKQRGLCYICLKPGHRSFKCKGRSHIVCTVQGCEHKQSHNTLIHRKSPQPPIKESDSADGSNPPMTPGSGKKTHVSVFESDKQIYQPIVPVIVNDGVCVFALLDEGSNSTHVSQKLVTEFNLNGPEVVFEQTSLHNVGDINTKIVSLSLTSVTGEIFDLSNIFVVSECKAIFPAEPIDLDKYPYLEGIPLPLMGGTTKVDLGIGLDNSHLSVPLQVVRDKDLKNPYAVLTPLGWCLKGPATSSEGRLNVNTHLINTSHDDIREQLSTFNDIPYDLADEFKDGRSQMDDQVIKFWDDNCVLENGHYTLPIPWKGFKRPLFPNNYRVALSRLFSLKRKLEKKG